MKIIPIAADSLGTRSMATFVETEDCNICIDPAVSLGPRRYGLPPHPLEYKKRDEHWESIKKHAEGSDVLILTHYHYDHHDPEFPELYRGKTVFIKHPTENINRSQKGRAALFLKRIDGMPEKLEYADGREFSFGDTGVRFSDAVFHGTGSRLGYVVETCIREGDESFVFTSDVEGPNTKEQTDFILKENPGVVYLDGPLSYMLGYRYSYESLAGAVENILSILNGTDVEKLVIDHHLLRDLNWKEKIARVFDAGKEVLTAAEFLGVGNNQLEARRKELFKEHPVRESTLERWEVEE
jgi:predicted metallo-beta-lactamase superfamily hydrolase